MNVFVLCTGRCASMTFARAAAHLTNYTAGHESRAGRLGLERVAFAADHVEVDNRLTWFLGRLEAAYPFGSYVHLRRDREETARSFLARYDSGIIGAYRRSVLMGLPEDAEPIEVCRDYVDTVTAQIERFLRDKPHWMEVRVENARADFAEFWQRIEGQGDLAGALHEWDVRYNAGPGEG